MASLNSFAITRVEGRLHQPGRRLWSYCVSLLTSQRAYGLVSGRNHCFEGPRSPFQAESPNLVLLNCLHPTIIRQKKSTWYFWVVGARQHHTSCSDLGTAGAIGSIGSRSGASFRTEAEWTEFCHTAPAKLERCQAPRNLLASRSGWWFFFPVITGGGPFSHLFWRCKMIIRVLLHPVINDTPSKASRIV